MAGDEIVADWLGESYSHRYVLSTTAIARFYATSLRYRTVYVYNFHATQDSMLGQYITNLTTFGNHAIILSPGESIKLEYVDLYELGHLAPGAVSTLNILALNRY